MKRPQEPLVEDAAGSAVRQCRSGRATCALAVRASCLAEATRMSERLLKQRRSASRAGTTGRKYV